MQAVTEGSLIILLYQGVIYGSGKLTSGKIVTQIVSDLLFYVVCFAVWIGVIYLISGFGGRVLSSLFIRSSISVGASGALFGLLGAMLSELLTNWTIYTNKTHQAKAREHQQQLQLQQMQFMQQRHVQLQRGNPNHPSLNGLINTLNSDGILGGLSTASVLSTKMYAEELKNPHSMDSEAFTQLLDASRMALLKSASNHPRQLVQGNQAGVSAVLQQIQFRSQQTTDIKTGGNLGVAQRFMPMDTSSIYGQGIIQAKSGLGCPNM